MAVYNTAGQEAIIDRSRAAGAAQQAAARSRMGSTTDGASGGVQAAAGSPRVGRVAAAVLGAGQSVVQGAREGLVGAYDAAAGAAASAADTIKHTAAQVTGSEGSGQVAAVDAAKGDGFGHGSGSSSSPSGGGYAGGEGSSLGQAWEDLKHGGSKAPRAVSSAGETAAAHDVTSNVERSKHLEQPQQAKVYDAEVYRVAPGSQAHQLSDQEQSRAAAGAVAGAKHQVTGAVPHDKPDSSKVTPDQPNRFAGDKGISTGFGTGSAAGWNTDSVKTATQHFVNSSSSSADGLPVSAGAGPAAAAAVPRVLCAAGWPA
ncbi:hypothetical protein COO60DRAFT_655584 [Scenedesmus sp. NREL 46B-D3]|nr:hypothetical protein COO60DRAFT_655584 [Scenedesmus sp. NREL 46B-D3]